jgi:hypothetical protein
VASPIALPDLLRDDAASTARDLLHLLRMGLLIAAEMSVAAGLDRLFGASSSALAILFALVATAVMLHRDWRRMLGAQAAFPAGRLA